MQAGTQIGAAGAACAAFVIAGIGLATGGAVQGTEADVWGTDLAAAVKESRKSQRPLVAVFR